MNEIVIKSWTGVISGEKKKGKMRSADKDLFSWTGLVVRTYPNSDFWFNFARSGSKTEFLR